MKNKTINNLKVIHQQLDDACGLIDNAMVNISNIDLKFKVIEMIDFTAIVRLKQEIETLIEEKQC